MTHACLVSACLAAVVSIAAGQAQEPGLRPGDVAPAFSLPGSDGQTYRLADFKGVRPVVLAWFPKTFAKP
jgi:peroxiredoxin Q/BCP